VPPADDGDRLSGADVGIIDLARQIARVSGPAVVRAHFGTTAVSYADTAHAYANALSRATWVIEELLAIIERLADAGPEARLDG
jgi:hypothetical protein